MTKIKDIIQGTEENPRHYLEVDEYKAATLRRAAKKGLFTNTQKLNLRVLAHSDKKLRRNDLDWIHYLKDVEVLDLIYHVNEKNILTEIAGTSPTKCLINDGACDGVELDMDSFSSLKKLRELYLVGSVMSRNLDVSRFWHHANIPFSHLKIKGKLENMRVASADDTVPSALAFTLGATTDEEKKANEEAHKAYRPARGVFMYNCAYFGLFGDDDWKITGVVKQYMDEKDDVESFQ